MKKSHLLYVVSLSLVLFQTSCKKDDEPKVEPVVGEWNLDKVSQNFPSPYQTSNASFSAAAAGYERNRFTIKSDKTFTYDIRETPQGGGQIYDGSGEWMFSNNTLTLINGADENEYKFENNELATEFIIDDQYYVVDKATNDTSFINVTIKSIYKKAQ